MLTVTLPTATIVRMLFIYCTCSACQSVLPMFSHWLHHNSTITASELTPAAAVQAN